MPFSFIIVGIVLLVAGARGQSSQLLALLKSDLTGTNNYAYWILSILVIGALGYVKDLQSLSRAFLVLVIIVLILTEDKNGNGFFTEFQQAISTITGGSNG